MAYLLSSYLPVAGFGFSLVGGFVLSRGLRAERNSAPAHAGSLYAVALFNYVVSYASFLAGRLVGPWAAPDRPEPIYWREGIAHG
jgi:hypothetical protein